MRIKWGLNVIKVVAKRVTARRTISFHSSIFLNQDKKNKKKLSDYTQIL